MGRRPSSATAAGGAHAARVVEQLIRVAPGTRVTVGFARKCGEGLSRMVFIAPVELSPNNSELSGNWMALVPTLEGVPNLAERVELEVRIAIVRAQRAFAVRRGPFASA